MDKIPKSVDMSIHVLLNYNESVSHVIKQRHQNPLSLDAVPSPLTPYNKHPSAILPFNGRDQLPTNA